LLAVWSVVAIMDLVLEVRKVIRIAISSSNVVVIVVVVVVVVYRAEDIVVTGGVCACCVSGSARCAKNIVILSR